MPVIVLCLLTSNKNHLFCLLVSNKSIIFAHVSIYSIYGEGMRDLLTPLRPDAMSRHSFSQKYLDDWNTCRNFAAEKYKTRCL